MDEKLLSLPWQIQLALAGGYSAYSIAYSGIRDHHKAVDTAFRSTAFGLVVVAVLYILRDQAPLFRGGVAFGTALAAGALWRAFGAGWWRKLLRSSNVSWADDSPSAWARIQGDNRALLEQISVELEDGTWLNCDDAPQFAGELFGPCLLGTNGDVALYVTSSEVAGETTHPPVKDAFYGTQLTYVPASRVKQIVLRQRPARSA